MNAAGRYFDQSIELLHHIREDGLAEIDRAADVCAQAISKGGLVFLFGAGHSRISAAKSPR